MDSEKSIKELIQDVKRKKRLGKSYLEALTEIHKRIAIPFSVLFFALIGVAIGDQRIKAGRFFGFILSLVILLFYFLLINFTSSLGEEGILSPWLAAWSPNLVFGGIAIYLFSKARREEGIHFSPSLKISLPPIIKGVRH